MAGQTQGGLPNGEGTGMTKPMRPPIIMLPSEAKTETEIRAKIIIITIKAAISRLRMVESEIFLIEFKVG